MQDSNKIPVLNLTEENPTQTVIQPIVTEPVAEPTLLEEVKAGYGSSAWSALAATFKDASEEQDPNFNPFNKENLPILTEGLTPAEVLQYTPNFARAKNLTHLTDLKQEVLEWKRVREVASHDSGLLGTAAYTFGILGNLATDPLNIFIGATTFKMAANAISAFKVSPYIAGAGAGAAQSMLYSKAYNEISQGTYSQTEDEYNQMLLFSTITGAGVGALLGKGLSITQKEVAEAVGNVDNMQANKILADSQAATLASNKAEGKYAVNVLADGNIGAAKLDVQKIEVLDAQNNPSWLREKLFKTGVWAAKLYNPAVRLLTSPFNTANKFSVAMTSTGLKTNYEAQAFGNLGAPADKLVQVVKMEHVLKDVSARDKYFAMAKQQTPGLTKRQFEDELTAALVNNRDSNIPAVQKYLEEHWDPMTKNFLKEQQARGINEGVEKRGKWYYPVKHDQRKIVNNYGEAVITYAAAIKKKVTQELSSMEGTIKPSMDNFFIVKKELETMLDNVTIEGDVKLIKRALNNLYNFNEDIRPALQLLGMESKLKDVMKVRRYLATKNMLEKNEFEEIARDFLDDITSKQVNDIFSTAFEPKSFKNIKINVNREDIAKFVSDADSSLVLRSYVNDHSRAMILVDKFGDIDGKALENALSKEYKEALLKAGGDTKKIDKLSKQYSEDLKDIQAGLRRFLGQKPDGSRGYDGSDFTYDLLTTLTSFKLMSASALAQITDSAPIITEIASGKWGKFSQEIMSDGVGKIKALRKEDQMMIGNISERLDERVTALFNDTAASGDLDGNSLIQKFGRALSVAKSANFKLNTMTLWNDVIRPIPGEHIARNMIESAIVYGKNPTKLSAEELAVFRKYGITENDFSDIVNNFNKHSVLDSDGYRHANIDKWDGPIRYKVLAAIGAEVDNVYVINPGVLTKSLWTDGNFLRYFAQYQGYPMKAFESILLPVLQEGSPKEYTKMLFRHLLGMTSYMMRAAVKNPIEDIDTEPKRLIYEGFIRGSVLPGIDSGAMLLDQLAKVTNLPIGPAAALGIYNTRSSARGSDIRDVIGGASSTVIKDTNKLLNGMGKDNFGEKAIEILGSYTPIYNAWYFQAVKNKLTE